MIKKQILTLYQLFYIIPNLNVLPLSNPLKPFITLNKTKPTWHAHSFKLMLTSHAFSSHSRQHSVKSHSEDSDVESQVKHEKLLTCRLTLNCQSNPPPAPPRPHGPTAPRPDPTSRVILCSIFATQFLLLYFSYEYFYTKHYILLKRSGISLDPLFRHCVSNIYSVYKNIYIHSSVKITN